MTDGFYYLVAGEDHSLSSDIILSEGSYSYSFTGDGSTMDIGFVTGQMTTTAFDNIKLTYTTPASVSFLADVVQITDYSPFGVQLDGRNIAKSEAAKSRYGYQSSEMDDEIKGEGNSINFEYRMHDTRLGRFFAVDPLAEKYPSWSPYAYALNNPIRFIDPDGMATEDPIGPGRYSASINSRYIGFGLRHPIAAMRIGFGVTKGASDISTNATRFATRGEVLYGSKRGQTDEGSENGAFRHALWQSTITSEFGNKTAKEAGNAHEENPFAITGSNLKTSFNSLAKADETVDLLNNVIGRVIGEANKGASMDELANLVLDEFKNNGLYTATKDKNGNWNVSKTKLSTEKYDQLKEIFKGLNENGRTTSEQKERDAETIKKVQQMDRGSKW
jgi:RHS repeat-associated protein